MWAALVFALFWVARAQHPIQREVQRVEFTRQFRFDVEISLVRRLMATRDAARIPRFAGRERASSHKLLFAVAISSRREVASGSAGFLSNRLD
jgi:hypothetical protein